MVSSGFLLLISCLATAIIGAVTLVQKRDETQTIVDGTVAEVTFAKSLLAIGLGVPIIVGNLMIFVTTPPLADHLERHSTNTGKERSIVIKLTFFGKGLGTRVRATGC